VGHIQRSLEESGIPTVGVYVNSFGHIPEMMGVSRALITHHLMGRPLGAPGDTERQRDVVIAALAMLKSGPALKFHSGRWRPKPGNL